MGAIGHTLKPLVEIQDANDCWEWQGSVNKKTGYGKKQYNGITILAHRWVYESLLGPIPHDKVINHKCSNRKCVNPTHLEAVTQTENCRHGKGTKLNRIQAKTIKRLTGKLPRGYKQLIANRYGVSRQLVNDIQKGRAWKEL